MIALHWLGTQAEILSDSGSAYDNDVVVIAAPIATATRPIDTVDSMTVCPTNPHHPSTVSAVRPARSARRELCQVTVRAFSMRTSQPTGWA